MNRSDYYNYIEERLASLSRQIEIRSKLNLLDYHIHSEYFYRDLFNILYSWNLQNLNDIVQNAEAIDLVDSTNHFIIQVTSTNTKDKIDDSLSKPFLKNFNGYTFKFISIAKAAENLRIKQYNPPQGISFTPELDIYDIQSILKDIKSKKINEIKEVYDFIRKELGRETIPPNFESNLATIIQLLSKEDLLPQNDDLASVQKSFEIDNKIKFNKISKSKSIIDDYKIYQSTVDRVYSEFDKLGQNKSLSVLCKIRKIYLDNQGRFDADPLFELIVKTIKDIIIASANYNPIPDEELELCVYILVVDAFIQCKIFENPNNYNYVTS